MIGDISDNEHVRPGIVQFRGTSIHQAFIPFSLER